MQIVDYNYEDNESKPLDFRRDWLNDLKHIVVDLDKEGWPASTNINAILKNNIATITYHDDFLNNDDDGSSYDSFPTHIYLTSLTILL